MKTISSSSSNKRHSDQGYNDDDQARTTGKKIKREDDDLKVNQEFIYQVNKEVEESNKADYRTPITQALQVAGAMLVRFYNVQLEDIHEESPSREGLTNEIPESLIAVILQKSDWVLLKTIRDVVLQEQQAYGSDEDDSDDDDNENGILHDSSWDRRFNHHQYYSDDFVVRGCPEQEDINYLPTA